MAERCKKHGTLNGEGLGFAQCKERVTTDPKLIANEEAQCTAFYLDFFKCADACVRSRFRPLSPLQPPSLGRVFRGVLHAPANGACGCGQGANKLFSILK